MSYRATGRLVDPNSLPLVKEELRRQESTSEEVQEPVKGNPAPKQESLPNPDVRYILESDQGEYQSNGFTVIFPSRNAAKQIRNKLNRKNGSGYYFIKRVAVEELVRKMFFY